MKIALVIVVGYMASVRICHVVFGGIGSGIMSMIAHAAGNMAMTRAIVQRKIGQGTDSGRAGNQLLLQQGMDKSHHARGKQMAQGGPEPVLAREQQNHNNQPAGIMLSSAEYSQPELPIATGNWRDDAANMVQYGADIRTWERNSNVEYANLQTEAGSHGNPLSVGPQSGEIKKPLPPSYSLTGSERKPFPDSSADPSLMGNSSPQNQYVPGTGTEHEAGGTELQNV